MTSEFRSAMQMALDAFQSGRILAQRWSDGALTFYPRGSRAAAAAGSARAEEIRDATVVARTTVREHSHPEFQAEAPFTLVLVEHEGARFMCRLDRAAPIPAVGDRVVLSVQQTERGPVVIAS